VIPGFQIEAAVGGSYAAFTFYQSPIGYTQRGNQFGYFARINADMQIWKALGVFLQIRAGRFRYDAARLKAPAGHATAQNITLPESRTFSVRYEVGLELASF